MYDVSYSDYITSKWYYDIKYFNFMVGDCFNVYFCEVYSGRKKKVSINCMGNICILYSIYFDMELFEKLEVK